MEKTEVLLKKKRLYKYEEGVGGRKELLQTQSRGETRRKQGYYEGATKPKVKIEIGASWKP